MEYSKRHHQLRVETDGKTGVLSHSDGLALFEPAHPIPLSLLNITGSYLFALHCFWATAGIYRATLVLKAVGRRKLRTRLVLTP